MENIIEIENTINNLCLQLDEATEAKDFSRVDLISEEIFKILKTMNQNTIQIITIQ